MKISSVLLLVIGAILLLTCTASAVDIPNVVLPSVNQGTVVSTDSPTVDLYRPKPYCVECMPEPTPAPVYETVGISAAVSKTKVRQNSMITFSATQVSGTPVLSTATWGWTIQPPRPAIGYSAKGMVVNAKVQTFGRWHIVLTVRDSIQMLQGHTTADFTISEKR